MQKNKSYYVIPQLFIFVICVALTVSFISCNKDKKNTFLDKPFSKENCGCDSLWSKKATKDFISVLENTTKTDYLIWKEYNLKDGVYILNSGKITDSTYCLGMWKGGKNISYKCAQDIPIMLTPLYSYYLNYNADYNQEEKLFGTYKNAPDFTDWMKNYNVETAIYMPSDFSKFPFKLSAKTKTQLAIHEAFHVQVMLRKWYTDKGYWPDWDTQPDRKAVQRCYTKNDEIISIFNKEHEALITLIEFLLDDDKVNAIKSAKTFIKQREIRYRKLLSNQQVKFNDVGLGDCSIGESFMEIEEGLADYASWVIMYNIGTVSREDLLKRYRAKQKDMFYLTGAMLLHASSLMNNGNDKEIISKMVDANTVEEGNLFMLFKEQFETYKLNFEKRKS